MSGAERWRRGLPDDFDGYLMKAMGSYDWKFSESPLVDGDRVIVTPGHIQALVVALDKTTGEEIWRTQGRRLGPVGSDGAAYSSAVSYADGRLYFRYQDGRMILVEARADAFHERGTFVIPDVEKESWSHPVIAHGKLFLREQDNLFCYDISGGARGD